MALRADFREHAKLAVQECGFQTIRQHGLFHDDMFVWYDREKPQFFGYVDSVYDYYLSIGLRPFVELSYVPRWMASDDKTVCPCKCPACPPNDLNEWQTLVRTTVRHLEERYGLDEIRGWHFEVWNEPNIPFWSGTQQQYFDFYRASVEAVNSVDADLRVGGPATSNFSQDEATGEFRPNWVEEFMAFCDANHLPAVLISAHPYPTNFPFHIRNLYGINRHFDATDMGLTVKTFAGRSVLVVAWMEEERVHRLLDLAQPDTRLYLHMPVMPLEDAKAVHERLRARCPRV